MIQMSRAEIQASLRAERLKATQRLMVLKREISERQDEITILEDRLESINQAEGTL